LPVVEIRGYIDIGKAFPNPPAAKFWENRGLFRRRKEKLF
jgi:hypothetical protein